MITGAAAVGPARAHSRRPARRLRPAAPRDPGRPHIGDTRIAAACAHARSVIGISTRGLRLEARVTIGDAGQVDLNFVLGKR